MLFKYLVLPILSHKHKLCSLSSPSLPLRKGIPWLFGDSEVTVYQEQQDPG